MRHLTSGNTRIALVEARSTAVDRASTAAGYAKRAFGHSRDRTQLVDGEATAIREAARRVLDGETHTVVVGDWNRRGFRTTAGGPWRVNAFSALLVQERLLGTKHPDGSTVAPAILDRETHDRLVALRRSRGKGVRRPPVRYLLTGLLICWRCGSRLCGMKACNKRMYVCQPPGHGGCSGTFVKADETDVIVHRMVADHVDSSAFAHSVAARRRWLEASDTDPLPDLQPMADLAGTGAALVSSWDTVSFEERRRLLDIVVDHIVVLPARGRQNRFAERLCPVWRA